MDSGFIIGLLVLLFILFLGYNILLQHKERTETLKKHEITKQKVIIAKTEEMIDYSRVIPFNQRLFACMHGRILDAVNMILIVDPNNKEFKGENVGRQKIIEQLLSQEQLQDSCKFQIPKNDKQAIIMLKIIKRIKDALRSEHNKGRIHTEHYAIEMERLDFLQVRVNIENALQRAKEAISMGQYGTALQLLNKSIAALSSRTDEYSVVSRDKMETYVNKLEAKQRKRSETERQALVEKQEIDDLFGQKKKW